MIIVDRALQQRQAEGRPVRVALVGAGFMGRGFVNQVVNSVPGMELVAIANRTVSKARDAYEQAGVTGVVEADDVAGVERAISAGQPVVSASYEAVVGAGQVDAVVEATGNTEYGAHVVLHAIESGKHIVLLNAEVDGTAGLALRKRAEKAGVLYTGCDGDQPGVQMNLLRFVKGIGVTPLVAGNIKGLQDEYRNPTTQEGFAKQWGQDPYMVTSFADGTKVSFEQALVANAVRFTVERRGMRGADHRGHVDELVKAYDVDALKELGGVVDYVVGSKPGPGVYVLGTHDDPKQKHYLNLYKLGEGPLYSFYTPYHLCHFEVPLSVARVVLFRDPVIQPIAGPMVDVVTTAKTDLKAGDTLDALGGYKTYGQCENYDVSRVQNLLPIGMAQDCRLKRDVRKDEVLTYADVEIPAGRTIDRLRAEQDVMFPVQAAAAAAAARKSA